MYPKSFNLFPPELWVLAWINRRLELIEINRVQSVRNYELKRISTRKFSCVEVRGGTARDVACHPGGGGAGVPPGLG